MVHNFTQENHSNVSRFFVAINPDANDRVIALAQQFRGKHSRVLARIGGSGLVDSIIREHSRMASVKRSARQQIDAVFSNMSAADIPYGQTTLSDLNSANSLIATFLNALGIAAFDVKTGGIDNIDRSVRYLASAGVTSGGSNGNTDTGFINLFGTIITGKTWKDYEGSDETIRSSQWKNYIAMLIDLDNKKGLDYGTACPGGETSLKYYNKKLYIDCWGLIKTGAKVLLTKEQKDKLVLDGPVNKIYETLLKEEKAGDITQIIEKDKKGNVIKITYPELKTGTSVFIDNKKEKTNPETGKKKYVGYDHVMTYIEDLDYTDKKGKKRHIDHALVGIGEKGKGLQIYDLDQKYKEWNKKKVKIQWGDQLHVEEDVIVEDVDVENF